MATSLAELAQFVISLVAQLGDGCQSGRARWAFALLQCRDIFRVFAKERVADVGARRNHGHALCGSVREPNLAQDGTHSFAAIR